MTNHEADLDSVRGRRRQHQITFVLSVGIVDDDHHLAFADRTHELFSSGKAHCPSSLSRYLASTSNSRFTVFPLARKPRLVAVRV